MRDQDWETPYARAMTVFLNGDALTEPGPHGEPVRDDSFLVMLSADREPLEFTMPGKRFGTRWAVVLDTADDGSPGLSGTADGLRPGERLKRTGNSMIVLRRTAPG
jgi:glycogen operon protein